jgi:putative FmdB family regulatory protein
MPIYEYRCEQGHTFEVTQRMTDDPVTICSSCDAPVQRVFHPVAVHFKGSGFYSTDYGKKKTAAAGSSSAADSGSGSESKKDYPPKSSSSSDSASKPKSDD